MRRLTTDIAGSSEGPTRKPAELRQLRQALREVRATGAHSADERALATVLRSSREQLASALGSLTACAGCATPYPLPASQWPGGFCCSGRTDALFDEGELAALHASGTRPRHLRPPRAARAGCLFRGPAGCSLPPRHRPNQCLRYLCRDVQHELHARRALARVEELCQENKALFERLLRLRKDRLERSFCDNLATRIR
ncbi:MAG: hypothetical protein ABI333_12850 [bacterium]